jgi:hypothetical protein
MTALSSPAGASIKVCPDFGIAVFKLPCCSILEVTTDCK